MPQRGLFRLSTGSNSHLDECNFIYFCPARNHSSSVHGHSLLQCRQGISGFVCTWSGAALTAWWDKLLACIVSSWRGRRGSATVLLLAWFCRSFGQVHLCHECGVIKLPSLAIQGTQTLESELILLIKCEALNTIGALHPKWVCVRLITLATTNKVIIRRRARILLAPPTGQVSFHCRATLGYQSWLRFVHSHSEMWSKLECRLTT